MTQKIIEVLLLFCAIFLASIFFILPFSRTHVFASPDESAVYAAAQAIAHTGSARASFAVLPEFPSLHPRSWVLQQGTLVPVGFLGLPILLALPSYLGNERGAMVAVAFLVVSAVFPLWQLSKRWGRVAQWISVFMYLTFPTVILYANRSLFPNLPATILTLWASYLFYRSERVVGILLSGILFAFALSVRPTEILWMTLWFVAACLVKRKEKKW